MDLTTADEPLSPAAASVPLRAVTRAFVADALTPISAYLALAQPGRSCLLESVEGTDRISRFSFIGLDYLESVELDRDPALLARVRAVLERYRVDTAGLPFPGGAVAVFSYDAVRSIERVGSGPAADAPVPDAVVVVPGTWVVFDHFTHRCTLLGFAISPADEARVADRLDAYLARLLRASVTLPADVRAVGPVAASLSEREYLERAARAKGFITDGEAYQLQLGIRFSTRIAGGSAFDLYRQLRTRNPSPYMFYVEHGGRAVFGASPEFLVRLDGDVARLRPLAGTRRRGADPAADAAIAAELLADQKERAEHVMLVDLGRNDLGAVCATGTVRVDELMVVERYSHVMHIVSNVVGRLRPDRDALDLFAAAFPAGTVTGAPKIRAMQLIDELEPVRRGFYAGSVAHLDFDGGMDSCIVLRSMQVDGETATWQASAGIVADSIPAAEYAEVYAKTAIARAALGLPS